MGSTRPKPPEHRAYRKQLQEAVHNPQTAFDHPMEVVQAPQLPIEQKQEALDTWEQDEQALQRASEEGMAGGPAPRLREVKQAKRELKEKRTRN
jgi:hypothetical protein